MIFASGIAAVPLLAFVVIGTIVGAINVKASPDFVDPGNVIRYAGGWNVSHASLNFMVAIVDNERRHKCAGAIINSRQIIVAAHCVDAEVPSLNIVRSNSQDLEDKNMTESTVSQIFIHPNYVKSIPCKTEVQNDIAIVEVKKDLLVDGRLRAVSLPTAETGQEYVWFYGWGIYKDFPITNTTKLHGAFVRVMAKKQACGNVGVTPRNPQFLCGIPQYAIRLDVSCGGMLVANKKLIGVGSSGYGLSRIPDFYTNVYHYLDWINKIQDDLKRRYPTE